MILSIVVLVLFVGTLPNDSRSPIITTPISRLAARNTQPRILDGLRYIGCNIICTDSCSNENKYNILVYFTKHNIIRRQAIIFLDDKTKTPAVN
jgi:hypothetical protein